MALVTVSDSTLTDIADAIRTKLDTEDTYKPSEMADAIESISGGGGSTLGTKTITQNGIYDAEDDSLDGYSEVTVNVSGGGITPTGTKNITANGANIDVAQYAYVDVAVPNSYSAGDEGKVVSSGALVSQTSDTVTTNGTVDTTLINSLTVNVSSGITFDDFATNAQPTGNIMLTCSTVKSNGMTFQGGSNWTCSSNTVTSIESNGFKNAAKLKEAYFPNLTSLGGNSFYYATGLTKVDIGSANIKANEFNGSALNVLIMRKTSALQTLANVNAFGGTKFKSGGTGGTIYIPKVLYDHLGDGTSLDYKAASVWSTVEGYGTITWEKLEGSAYE